MIITLEDTSTSMVANELIHQRSLSGVVALGRVLTLVITATGDGTDIEHIIRVANDASGENPCRIIVIREADSDESRTYLNAEIRLGGDAGAAEVIVLDTHGELRDPEIHDSLVMALLLPDAPVVAWWPHLAPVDPADSAIGMLAQRRITDSDHSPLSVRRQLERLRVTYSPGDTDLAWTRLTPWRQQLASTLDLPPHDAVTGARVHGEVGRIGPRLMKAWLGLCLNVDVTLSATEECHDDSGINHVELFRESGTISVKRISPVQAMLDQPSLHQREISLPSPDDATCMAEELRRLDSDTFYGDVLLKT